MKFWLFCCAASVLLVVLFDQHLADHAIISLVIVWWVAPVFLVGAGVFVLLELLFSDRA